MEQHHSPLTFNSGRFNAAQLGWSVFKKESFAVLNTLERIYLLVKNPDGLDLFMYHKNLFFLFDPMAVVLDMVQATLRKVLCWAVRLSMYNYESYHIKGGANV